MLFFFIISTIFVYTKQNEFELVHGFKWLNFTFNSAEEYNTYISTKTYMNCMLAGIKINSKDEIFVSVPRWKSNVPATLSKIITFENKTLLSPFPSWDNNKVGNASALQSVLGFEIDLEDNIWVLDQGKVNGKEAIPGSLKLVKYNVNGSLIRLYDLNKVADVKSSFLNDLVLDLERNFAFITDSGINIDDTQPLKPGLIVLNLSDANAFRVLENHSSVYEDKSFWLTVNNQRVLNNSPMKTGADGIALSCDRETLYYTPLSSRTLYSIPTKYLISNEENLENYVFSRFKGSASDGLACSSKGKIYLTNIENNSVYVSENINSNLDNLDYRNFVEKGKMNESMWPDTLAFNSKNEIFFVSNQLHNFIQNEIDFENPKFGEYNFRVWKLDVDDSSYLNGCKIESNKEILIFIIIFVSVIGLILIAYFLIKYLIIKKKSSEMEKEQSLVR